MAETWRFNCFQNGSRPPSWILEIQIFQRSARLRDPFCIIVPNFAKIGQCIAVISGLLWFFQDGGRRHLGFWKILNFNGPSPTGSQCASSCQISSKSIKRLQADRYGDLTVFFQNGGGPPSWICRARIRTSREDYSVVFIVVLNLVGIAAVLSIIWTF